MTTYSEQQDPERKRPTRLGRRGRRAFTLLEVTIASGLFVLAASLISVVVAQSIASNIQTNEQRVLDQSLNSMANQIVNSPSSYSALLANTFTVPSACAGPSTTGTSVQSCVTISGRTFRASWSVTAGTDAIGSSSVTASSLTLGGSITLSPGVVVSVSQVIAAPSYAYLNNNGVVRVQVSDPGSLLSGPVYLLSMANPSSVMASGEVSGGVAVLRAVASSCSLSSPCVLGISSGNNYAVAGNAAMTASQVTGPAAPIVLTAGQATFATLQIRGIGQMTLNLTATNDSTGQTGLNPTAGSVCLYANFNDGTGDQSVPVCNFTRSESITLYDYAPDPTRPNVRIPLPVGVPLTLSTDNNTTGSCSQVDNPVGGSPAGLLGWTNSGWTQRAECTSWTWGDPTSLTVGSTTTLWGAVTSTFPTVTLSAGTTQTGSVNWSAPGNATNVFVVDKTAGTVRMVTQAGVTTSFYSGLASPQGMAEDTLGNLYIANTGAGTVVKLTGSGTASTITGFVAPQDVAISADGTTLYVLDKNGSVVSVKKVTLSTNAVSTVTVSNTLSATAAGITVDSVGDLYIADTGNNRIIAIPSAAGAGSAVACTSECVLVTSANLSSPVGLTVDPSGYLDVADSGSTGNNPNSVVQVDPTWVDSAWVLVTGLSSPQRVTSDVNGNFYVTQNGSSNNKVLLIDSTGTTSTLAGSGTAAEVNGTGAAAQFNGPAGVATVGGWQLSQPAVGFGNVAVWSMPRQARTTDCDSSLAGASCTSNSGGYSGAVENTNCTNQFQLCYEAQVSYLTGPQVGGMNSVAVSGSTGVTVSFTLNVADYVGATTVARVTALAGSGTLTMGTNSASGATYATNSSTVTTNLQIASLPSGGGLINMKWTEGASQITQTWFTVSLNNGLYTKSYDVALYRTAGGWVVNGYTASVAQGASGTISSLVTLVNGQNATNRTVTFSCSSCSGITFSPSSVSSQTAGVASTTVNVAAGTTAGTYPVTVSVDGRSGTAYVRVTAVLGSLAVSLSPSSIGQGATSTATITARDTSGATMANVATALGVKLNSQLASGVYAPSGGCLTGSNGTCTLSVTAETGAAPGSYSVSVTSGAKSASASLSVSAAPLTLIATAGAVLQGSSATTTVYDYDGTGTALSGRTISYSSSKSGLSVTSGGATNASGLGVANISAAASVAPGSYNVTATDGAATVTFVVTVSGVPASVGAASVNVTAGSSNTSIVTVLDANGNGVPGQVLTITSQVSGVNVVSHATTSSSGTATISIYVASSTSKGTKSGAVLIRAGSHSTTINVTVQ